MSRFDEINKVTDKELIKYIKSISKKLDFKSLFFLTKPDIDENAMRVMSGRAKYQGKDLNEDKKQKIKELLQNNKAVKNLLIKDKKQYNQRLDSFFGKSKGSIKRSFSNSRAKTLKPSPRTSGSPLSRERLRKMVGGDYNFDDPSIQIANEAVKNFMNGYNYTDFLLTNTLLISDINFATYMLYGDIMRLTEGDHNTASRIVFLFRVSLSLRIAFVNILVVGFLYLTYRNAANVDITDILNQVNSLIFNGLIFNPRDETEVQGRSGVGFIFSTIYGIINSVIPVRMTIFSVSGLFVMFGDSIREVLQPNQTTQNGLPVAQEVPNNTLMLFILNGARAGVIVRDRVLRTPQVAQEILGNLINLVVNRNQRTRSVSQRPNTAPQMNIMPSRMINTTTGQSYNDVRSLMSPRQSSTERDAIRAIGFIPRPYSAPQGYRFETRRRREEAERTNRRRVSEREGYGTPEGNLSLFYNNEPSVVDQMQRMHGTPGEFIRGEGIRKSRRKKKLNGKRSRINKKRKKRV